ncbi:RNA polymerase sigma factor [Oryzobacter telluris]|uniref:RNA polymerase sigma factor n=1 Tax=Oryzobacter telluris TaxID=3149179 RepID=UPI00370DBDE3
MTERVGPGAVGEDARRFEALVHAVHQPLLRYLLRRADHETAADVLGDTLLVLWRRRDEVPPDAALPWAYGVARGCLANARRGARRRAALVARLVVVDPPRPVTGPEETAAADDLDLHAALARLTPTEAEVVALWAWEGLSPSEIAVALDITPNAVSIRLHRAKARLRDLLGGPPTKDRDADRTQTGRGKEER